MKNIIVDTTSAGLLLSIAQIYEYCHSNWKIHRANETLIKNFVILIFKFTFFTQLTQQWLNSMWPGDAIGCIDHSQFWLLGQWLITWRPMSTCGQWGHVPFIWGWGVGVGGGGGGGKFTNTYLAIGLWIKMLDASAIREQSPNLNVPNVQWELLIIWFKWPINAPVD